MPEVGTAAGGLDGQGAAIRGWIEARRWRQFGGDDGIGGSGIWTGFEAAAARRRGEVDAVFVHAADTDLAGAALATGGRRKFQHGSFTARRCGILGGKIYITLQFFFAKFYITGCCQRAFLVPYMM